MNIRKMILILALALACFARTGFAQGQATIVVERKFSFYLLRLPVHVFVNGADVGELPNGTTAEFVFNVKPRRNIISVEYFGDKKITINKSKSVDFEAHRGDILLVTIDTNQWAWSSKDFVIVTVRKLLPNVVVDSIVLSKNVILRKASVEHLQTVPGVKAQFKRSRTIEHEITINKTATLEGTVKVNLGVLSNELRGKLETVLGKSLKHAETREQMIEVDGNVVQRVQLVWVDQIRKGVAKVKVGGIVQTLPFEFQEGTNLKIISVPEPASTSGARSSSRRKP
jgi:hypothetical protein